ncbi:hypothetical protein SLEP1_g17005 [Rubroshorea leprosula]|uniref:Uncharacterized protein n=1 Tax=Rubroshorea leprosula TaxID=152421 RepID=A0AAV5J4E0_9ROSI|nr:hypothetical protein SLEP1_g17005 [Rubroshorea leprosula]
MANSFNVLLVISLFLAALIISSSTVEAGGDNLLNWVPTTNHCHDPIAECLGNDEEFLMGSEISRRILQTATNYISYGALRSNTVPCSQRGASYYNCQPGAQANPYTRGCSAITQCRN